MKIEADVIDVLRGLDVSGAEVRIVQPLERPLYVRTNKVLEAIGGKWNTRAKAHLFKDDPAERIAAAVMTMSVVVPKDEFDFFPTPYGLAMDVVRAARIADGMTTLEPSAGIGHLAGFCLDHSNHLIAVEIQAESCRELEAMAARSADPSQVRVICADFLTLPLETIGLVDRVVMNPPFRRLNDVRHVRRAYSFLKPGGKLVAVMAPGWTFRQDAACRDFREFVDTHGHWEALPEGSFATSGTMVNTVLVELEA